MGQNHLFLNLPRRTEKPRSEGLTSLLDNGISTQVFQDVVTSFTPIIDVVKFGWCTALVTKDIERKAAILRELKLDYYLGGTLFEKALIQGKLKEFVNYSRSLKCTHIEVSNGTIDISNKEKAQYIKSLSGEFNVLSEVGYKDATKSIELSPARWIEFIREDLAAGATKVITEARESGKSGICRDNGELRFGLIAEILDSGLSPKDLIFEAPNKTLQVYFIKKVGPNVNLGNINFADPLGLETLRLGLRSDTLLHFEGKPEERPSEGTPRHLS